MKKISENNTIIENQTFSGSHFALEMHPDGRAYHTFRTASLLVDANHITFRNCTFENTAGSQREKMQAIALYLDGDDIHLENCRILGHQDTLFLAPLPKEPYEPDGFLGPGEFAPRIPHTMYFRNCYIEGGIDFIFGGATAYFDACEFRSIETGFVFAPCTPEDVPEGFVARNCSFTSSDDIPPGSCYIARPWRDHAKVRLEKCYLGPHINPAGWDDWGKKNAHRTVEFVEILSYVLGDELSAA